MDQDLHKCNNGTTGYKYDGKFGYIYMFISFILVIYFRDCAIITWSGGGGVGKPEGGHRGKSQLERGGVDVKFNTYRGGITFFTLFHKLEKR